MKKSGERFDTREDYMHRLFQIVEEYEKELEENDITNLIIKNKEKSS